MLKINYRSLKEIVNFNKGLFQIISNSFENKYYRIKVDTTNDGNANETIGATEDLQLVGGTNVTLAEADGTTESAASLARPVTSAVTPRACAISCCGAGCWTAPSSSL